MLTSTLTPPNASSATSTTAAHCVVVVTSRCTKRAASPSVVGHGLALVVEHVADDDLRALGDEAPRLGLTLTPRPPGDERDLPVEATAPSGLLRPDEPHGEELRAAAVGVAERLAGTVDLVLAGQAAHLHAPPRRSGACPRRRSGWSTARRPTC